MAEQGRAKIGIGKSGMGSMGRAHSSAFGRLAQVRTGAKPELLALACRSAEKGSAVAVRFGSAEW